MTTTGPELFATLRAEIERKYREAIRSLENLRPYLLGTAAEPATEIEASTGEDPVAKRWSREGEDLALRAERILLIMNQLGELSILTIAEHLGQKSHTTRYAIGRTAVVEGPNRDYAASRVSKLWGTPDTEMFGPPKVFEGKPLGRESRLAQAETEEEPEETESEEDDNETEEAGESDALSIDPAAPRGANTHGQTGRVATARAQLVDGQSQADQRVNVSRQAKSPGSRPESPARQTRQKPADDEPPVPQKTEDWPIALARPEHPDCKLCDARFQPHERICIATDRHGTVVMCEACARRAGHVPPKDKAKKTGDGSYC